jgi:purine nucleosidase
VRVVLDADPGVDDALAILLALRSPELDVVGITTVAGNVPVDQGTRNALAIVERVGAKVPVVAGAERPLAGRLTTATLFHGSDGLGDLGIAPAQARPSRTDAATFLSEAVRGDQPVTVVALGPLTNLAVACGMDPDWPRRVHQVIVMCGAVAVPGNVTAVAEANCYADPEAAAIVLESGAPVLMVPLDVTMRAALSRERFERSRPESPNEAGAVGLACALLDYYLAMASRVGSATAALHDPLAVAVACAPDLVASRRLRVDVELDGSLTRGQTVVWRSELRERVESRGDYDDVVGIEPVEGNVNVALEVDAGRFLDLFLERVLSAPSSAGPASS